MINKTQYAEIIKDIRIDGLPPDVDLVGQKFPIMFQDGDILVLDMSSVGLEPQQFKLNDEAKIIK